MLIGNILKISNNIDCKSNWLHQMKWDTRIGNCLGIIQCIAIRGGEKRETKEGQKFWKETQENEVFKGGEIWEWVICM